VKTRLICHSEEPRSDRDDEESRTVLKILRARFLASLGMTMSKRFHTDSSWAEDVSTKFLNSRLNFTPNAEHDNMPIWVATSTGTACPRCGDSSQMRKGTLLIKLDPLLTCENVRRAMMCDLGSRGTANLEVAREVRR
jgi:hypothetical protein